MRAADDAARLRASPRRAPPRLGVPVEAWDAAEDDFPQPLFDLHSPPARLYTSGRRELLAGICVAIVGTRASTPYGERVTRRLARAFTSAGACVVSGLARGIDATAHRAALEAGGATVAVTGTGVDVPYPVGHAGLQRRIAAEGLLISESEPGEGALKGCFPRRNRLIAALARMTIVVEAGVTSGAINTADHALDLHRTLAAVPGPIDAPQSYGTNQLIRDGAHPIISAEEALSLVGLSGAGTSNVALTGDARVIHDALGALADAGADELAARARVGPRRCLEILAELELSGLVERTASGGYRRA